MELAQEDPFPHVVNILLRILIAGLSLNAGKSSEKFDITEQEFGFPVVALVVCLTSVCAAMQFKVQFTIPSHQVESLRDLPFQLVKEVLNGVTDMHSRQKTSRITHATASAEFLQHHPSWATTAISLAKRKQRGVVLIHRFMLGYGSLDISKIGFRGIGLTRSHMTDDLAPIQSYPVEGGMRESVDVVPAQLLGEESFHTGQPANLGQLGRVAKSIG